MGIAFDRIISELNKAKKNGNMRAFRSFNRNFPNDMQREVERTKMQK